jgi:hypothetical protein
MHPDWPNDPLTPAQIKALRRLNELGINPYGWSLGDVGTSGATVRALEERALIYGANVYGGRIRGYIIQDAGRKRLASVDTHAERGDAQQGSVSDG